MAKTNLNILIDADLKARLKAIADQQNRTLSNLVETELKRVAATGQSAQTESKNRRG
jgi:antitoxin component of RelBE/YafQ-DinJ toxin-antitoxin module